jgi:hypothetical protein
MVPLRNVIESAGGTVEWDPVTRTATAAMSGNQVQVTIGSTQATVNGQTQYLDASPTLIGGRTLVPLGFLEAALGTKATYRPEDQMIVFSTLSPNLDAASEPEVEIVAQEGEPQDVVVRETIVVQEPAIIFVEVDRDDWVNAGDPVMIEMQGTPGLVGVARISGFDEDIAMTEREPGHYVATWTVPTREGLYLPDALVTVYLRNPNGNVEKSLVAVRRVALDAMAPTVLSTYPAHGERVFIQNAQVKVKLSDSGSGVNPLDYRLVVNGKDRTDESYIEGDTLIWRPMSEDVKPFNEVELTIRDFAGNESRYEWNFRTDQTERYSVWPDGS